YLFHLYVHRHHRILHTFPTRRSSDLSSQFPPESIFRAAKQRADARRADVECGGDLGVRKAGVAKREHRGRTFGQAREHRTHLVRSEEHTSELQSRVDLVCRLLLEKKT